MAEPSAADPRPLVTIVTPSYNQGEYITETIESVLGQDYPRIEYVVMDGGSTDRTLDILRRYDGRLRWVSQKDDGQSDAIHRGFSEARGEIIAWLNSDDLYTPGAVSRAVEALVSAPEAGFVYGRADFIDREGRPRGSHIYRQWDYDELVDRRNFIPQPATFFRHSAYEAIGGLALDLHYVMDYDLWIRLGREFPVTQVPDVLARIRLFPDTKTASGGLARIDEVRRMIARHGRSRLPEWLYWDYVRESIRATIALGRLGRRREALRTWTRAMPYMWHPMVVVSAARHVAWRGQLAYRRLAGARRSPDA